MHRGPIVRPGSIKDLEGQVGRVLSSLATSRASVASVYRGSVVCVWKREEACMYSGRLECWAATSSVWHGASRSNGRAHNRRFPTEIEPRQRQRLARREESSVTIGAYWRDRHHGTGLRRGSLAGAGKRYCTLPRPDHSRQGTGRDETRRGATAARHAENSWGAELSLPAIWRWGGSRI
jgi:hypothetical protein